MTETTPGREPIQIVEIQQPICANVFGVSPCAATGTNDTKCYNTRGTCRDTANFALDTPLSLFFSSGKVAEQHVSGAGYIIPSLMGVSTSPTRINLASASLDAQGLGNRALCTIRIKDHPHSDRVVDPYVEGRSWDPLSAERGSFWSRWMVRNKYRQNIVIKVYEGYSGQALGDMVVRTYFLDSVQGPDDAGNMTIKGKDVLARIEERKAQAPVLSKGELFADIDAVVTTFEASNAVEAEYTATGTIRISDEIMTYTGRATSTNGVTFTGVTRGTDNSTADEHTADDAVQQCLRYTDISIDDAVSDLLTTYGNIGAAFLDTTNWATEVSSYLVSYRLSTLITRPTAVSSLVSQLQSQALFYIWWDERDALVKLKAIRGIDVEPALLTDSANIISGSFSLTEKPRERASQVWVYYAQDDFTKAQDDPDAFASQFINANLESETDELYGEPSIRKIFANWISPLVLAQNTADKIITRYVDVPAQAMFRMDAKDRSLWVGDTVRISHYLDRDQYGARRIRNWTITSAEEVAPSEVVQYHAEDTTLYGRIHFVMANGTADYPGPELAPFKNCYIGNADGLLSDLNTCGTIS